VHRHTARTGAGRRFLADSVYEGEFIVISNSHEHTRRTTQARFLAGKLAGGLVAAWRFFGQFRLPHVLIRLVRLTNKLRLSADTPKINFDGVVH